MILVTVPALLQRSIDTDQSNEKDVRAENRDGFTDRVWSAVRQGRNRVGSALCRLAPAWMTRVSPRIFGLAGLS